MKTAIYTLIFIFSFCLSLSSQGKAAIKTQKKAVAKKEADQNSVVKLKTLRSGLIKINEIYFNKNIDYTGKGEILEVELRIDNGIDDPQDIYVFVVAMYEREIKKDSSFELPIPGRDILKTFVPHPEDLKNFQYSDPENSEKTVYRTYPKNPKAGINTETGKSYHLTDYLFIRTKHLSRYRNNFYYFNKAVILVYDKDGAPLFRQEYRIRGQRP